VVAPEKKIVSCEVYIASEENWEFPPSLLCGAGEAMNKKMAAVLPGRRYAARFLNLVSSLLFGIGLLPVSYLSR
jgi:hypothetical protein